MIKDDKNYWPNKMAELKKRKREYYNRNAESNQIMINFKSKPSHRIPVDDFRGINT